MHLAGGPAPVVNVLRLHSNHELRPFVLQDLAPLVAQHAPALWGLPNFRLLALDKCCSALWPARSLLW